MIYHLIWNITRACPWNCSICCVDSFHPTIGMIKNELNTSQRNVIIDHCSGYQVHLNISGGDPLLAVGAFETIEYAVNKFGKNFVSLSATGATLDPIILRKLSSLISEIFITYDLSFRENHKTRPNHYCKQNLNSASKFILLGGKILAECTLTVHNCNRNSIRKIFEDLHEAGVQDLLFMRYFPTGRALNNKSLEPSYSDIATAIDEARILEKKFSFPRIRLQCALRGLGFTDNTILDHCDLLRGSLGIMPDGTVLLSPWAYGKGGSVLSEEWIIGNLLENSLSDILNNPRVVTLSRKLNNNHGHCKFFAWLNSPKQSFNERLLDQSDSLKLSKEQYKN